VTDLGYPWEKKNSKNELINQQASRYVRVWKCGTEVDDLLWHFPGGIDLFSKSFKTHFRFYFPTHYTSKEMHTH
jgi:hypothetical protein